MLRTLLLSIIFSFVLKTGLSQNSLINESKKVVESIDSLVSRCKKEGVISMEFIGVIDSSFGKITGTIFLSESKTEIKYVQMTQLNHTNLIEYYCIANELVLVITLNHFYFRNGSFSITAGSSDKLNKELFLNFKTHSDYFKTIKIIAKTL